ncbi:unnamed protein product [Prorocentrum cordatum]|uniref:Uncharacterized protein n=1 Tax=Prorocentrum cordatum TaxID=2364126 RepID=A0ABN9XWS2_9DINO|nr:unnamed protein product [Polarella glacialis]
MELARKHELPQVTGRDPEGHLLQIFVRRALVDRFAYAALPHGTPDESRDPLSRHLSTAGPIGGQARLVANPSAFMRASSVRMYACSASREFHLARPAFQRELVGLLSPVLGSPAVRERAVRGIYAGELPSWWRDQAVRVRERSCGSSRVARASDWDSWERGGGRFTTAALKAKAKDLLPLTQRVAPRSYRSAVLTSPYARARLAARFSEEARRLHREVMHAHRAGELVASLDDAHHGGDVGVAAHSRAVAAELLSSPAGPCAEAEAVSVEGVEEDLRLQAKRMQLDLLRRQVQQQARQNAEQEHRNAAAMEEIEAHLTKLDDETGSLMARRCPPACPAGSLGGTPAEPQPEWRARRVGDLGEKCPLSLRSRAWPRGRMQARPLVQARIPRRARTLRLRLGSGACAGTAALPPRFASGAVQRVDSGEFGREAQRQAAERASRLAAERATEVAPGPAPISILEAVRAAAGAGVAEGVAEVPLHGPGGDDRAEDPRKRRRAAGRWGAGDGVALTGLRSRPELNGRLASILRAPAGGDEEGRYLVLLAPEGQQLSVRRGNMVPAPGAEGGLPPAASGGSSGSGSGAAAGAASAGPAERQASAEALGRWGVGDSVALAGLRGRPELNGRLASVLQAPAGGDEEGRWYLVLLAQDGRQLSVIRGRLRMHRTASASHEASSILGPGTVRCIICTRRTAREWGLMRLQIRHGAWVPSS